MTDFSLSQGLSALAALFFVHLLVVASPGPAFLAVSRTAISNSRTAGVTAAAAMATGALIWAVATLFGLGILFAKAPWLYDAMRLGGAAYLIYLGVGMLRDAWRGERMASDVVAAPASHRTFLRSLGVQLSNPKAAVFFGSIFVALLPAAAPLWVKCGALAILGVNEFGFYALVAVVLSTPRAQRIYGNARRGLDVLFGGFLTALGVKLALSR
ncbi:MAG TPA: LysE family transporter [Dongiaceae bacterium]|nr:LysE family transporter [Dongiaceae bacterium]